MEALAVKEDAAFNDLITALQRVGCTEHAQYLSKNNSQFKGNETEQDETFYQRMLVLMFKELENYWKQLLRDPKFRLEDVIVPLTIVEEDKNKAGTEVQSYEDLFKLCSGNPVDRWGHIVIQADAGMGKSTYVSKLAYDWAKGDKYLKKRFKMVVMIRLGQVKEATSFADILMASMPQQGSHTKTVLSILENPQLQEKVLLIFDGYDEISSTAAEAVKPILEGHLYPLAICLTTTRKTSLNSIPSTASVQLTIEGFTEESMNNYMDQRKAPPQVKTFIHSQDQVKELAQIPLLLALFCCLDREVDATKLRELFDVLRFTVDNLAYKKLNERGQSSTAINELWLKVGMFATEAVKKLEIYKQIPDPSGSPEETRHSMSIASNIGIIWAQTSFDRDIQATITDYQFPHQLFMEYFAGNYMASSSKHTQFMLSAISKDHQEKIHYSSCFCLQPLSYMISAHSKEYALQLITEKEGLVSSVKIPWVYIKSLPGELKISSKIEMETSNR
jgi:NACHT domain